MEAIVFFNVVCTSRNKAGRIGKKWVLGYFFKRKKNVRGLVRPMSGVASLTGSMSPTMVANMVMDSMIATPEKRVQPTKVMMHWRREKKSNKCDLCT